MKLILILPILLLSFSSYAFQAQKICNISVSAGFFNLGNLSMIAIKDNQKKLIQLKFSGKLKIVGHITKSVKAKELEVGEELEFDVKDYKVPILKIVPEKGFTVEDGGFGSIKWNKDDRNWGSIKVSITKDRNGNFVMRDESRRASPKISSINLKVSAMKKNRVKALSIVK